MFLESRAFECIREVSFVRTLAHAPGTRALPLVYAARVARGAFSLKNSHGRGWWTGMKGSRSELFLWVHAIAAICLDPLQPNQYARLLRPWVQRQNAAMTVA